MTKEEFLKKYNLEGNSEAIQDLDKVINEIRFVVYNHKGDDIIKSERVYPFNDVKFGISGTGRSYIALLAEKVGYDKAIEIITHPDSKNINLDFLLNDPIPQEELEKLIEKYQ